MLFDQRQLHICVTAHPLGVDQFLQFMVVQGLYGLLVEVEVLDAEGDSGVDLSSAPDIVSQVVVIVPDEIFLQCPFASIFIIDCCLGRKLRYELVVFDSLESEAVGRLVP